MSTQPQKISQLPKIKASVTIEYVGVDFWCDKVWIMYDQILSKYYYLGKLEFEIISRWDLGSADKIMDSINSQTIYKINAQQIETILKFLLSNNLLQVGRDVLSSLKKTKNNLIQLMSNTWKIFFYRIPLINPDKFLDKTKHIAKIFFLRGFLYLIVALFFLNLYLLAGNWGSFTASIPDITDASSIVLLGFTLIFCKLVHELGHAYACRLVGCPVPEMGVNLIFFYPLLYTDVSSSIKLDNSKRLFISTAGLRFELYLAVIAGVLWFFVPQTSGAKNLLFFIAAVSWVISLSINASPFVRYDGYFILSDYLKIRNLSARSIAVFKYYFRKYLFGIDASMPELYHHSKFRFFFIFAILTGIYRAVAFTSILLFLYYIEIVGAALFTLGVMMMLFIPLFREAYNIILLKNKMKSTRNLKITILFLFAVGSILFIPFGQNIYLPAIYTANIQRVHTPFSAKVDKINIRLGQDVTNNQALLELSNPSLDKDNIINTITIATDKYYADEAKISTKDRKDIVSSISELTYQKAIQNALLAKINQLEIKAPINGKIAALYSGLYNGLWLGDKSWLFDVVDLNKKYVQGFISAKELIKVSFKPNSFLTFIPDELNLDNCVVKFKSVATEPIDKIPNEPIVEIRFTKSNVINSNLLLFASDYGGEINFNIDSAGQWVPVDAYFVINTDYAENCNYPADHIIKGTLSIKSHNQSMLSVLFNKIAKLFTK